MIFNGLRSEPLLEPGNYGTFGSTGKCVEDTAAIEPEPGITWRGVTSLAGWVFLFAGIFFFVVGCSALGGLKCTGTLAFRSTLLTILGGLLLGISWMNWTNGEKLPRMMIAKKVLRKIAGLIVLGIVVLIFLFISLVVCPACVG